MLSIGKVIKLLDDKGKKPGSPSYSTAVKDAILFHFEVDAKDLEDEKKLVYFSKNIATKCKDLSKGGKTTVDKMLSLDLNKVRQNFKVRSRMNFFS